MENKEAIRSEDQLIQLPCGLRRARASLSGSAHSRSQSSPVSGTSVGRGMRFICSSAFSSGDSPPCMHRICAHAQAWSQVCV